MALKKRKAKKAAKKLTKRRVKRAVRKPVKKAAKKQVKKKAILKKKSPVKKPAKVEGKLIGTITHYFPHVQAAVIKMKAPVATGDTVKIKGHTTDITQVVTSLQIDRVTISSAKKGDEIGLQVSSRVRQGDKVYKG